MAYKIVVKNRHLKDDPGHERKLEVYHDSNQYQCDNKKCVLDRTGTGSAKEFSLSSSGDYLVIKFKDQDNKMKHQYHIDLPKKALFNFTPNGDYGRPGITAKYVNGIIRLTIPQGQVPAWSLRVIRPIGADRIEPPNDNVTVSEDAQ